MSLLRNPTITLTAIVACLFLGAACSSEGVDETSTTSDIVHTDDAQIEASTATSDVTETADDDAEATDDDAGAADDDDVVEAVGYCTNAADMAVAQDCDIDLPAIAQTIGISCLFDADPGACALPQMAEQGGISVECAGCYVQQVTCAADNCLTEGCMPDGDCLTDAAACAECRAEFCLPLWEVCSGFPPTDPEAPDPCASEDDPPDPCE